MICLHFFYALFGDYFIHLCVCVCMSDVALKLLDIQHAFSISINRLNSFDFAPLSYIYLLSELFFYVAVCLCERSIFAGLCHSIKFSLNRIWPMSHFSLILCIFSMWQRHLNENYFQTCEKFLLCIIICEKCICFSLKIASHNMRNSS